MVNLNIAITGKIPRAAAELLLKLLDVLADYFEFNWDGGFAEVNTEVGDVQKKVG